jgi:hypothetical protein
VASQFAKGEEIFKKWKIPIEKVLDEEQKIAIT